MTYKSRLGNATCKAGMHVSGLLATVPTSQAQPASILSVHQEFKKSPHSEPMWEKSPSCGKDIHLHCYQIQEQHQQNQDSEECE